MIDGKISQHSDISDKYLRDMNSTKEMASLPCEGTVRLADEAQRKNNRTYHLRNIALDRSSHWIMLVQRPICVHVSACMCVRLDLTTHVFHSSMSTVPPLPTTYLRI